MSVLVRDRRGAAVGLVLAALALAAFAVDGLAVDVLEVDVLDQLLDLALRALLTLRVGDDGAVCGRRGDPAGVPPREFPPHPPVPAPPPAPLPVPGRVVYDLGVV